MYTSTLLDVYINIDQVACQYSAWTWLWGGGRLCRAGKPEAYFYYNLCKESR